jgi:hypothetical protein
MSGLLSILSILAAIPKIISLVMEAIEAVREAQRIARVDKAKKGIEDGDNKAVEEAMGNDSPGTPSDVPGAGLRPKS